MEIAHMIYPAETLGPGKRVVIWTVGCSKRCEYCINPELWARDGNRAMAVPHLVAQVKYLAEQQGVDGITISGGDPLEQKEELLHLVRELHLICPDILVYTGYTLKEIDFTWTEKERADLRSNVSVLIDGRYQHVLNDNLCPLCGSTNQTIHYFDETLREVYERYRKEKGRTLQTFHYSGGSISVGIHNKEGEFDDIQQGTP